MILRRARERPSSQVHREATEAEKAQQRAEDEKKAEDEDKVPKYVLTKYERIECGAVWKSHRTPSTRCCRRDRVGSTTHWLISTQV